MDSFWNGLGELVGVLLVLSQSDMWEAWVSGEEADQLKSVELWWDDKNKNDKVWKPFLKSSKKLII